MYSKKVLLLGANFENEIGMEYGVLQSFLKKGFNVRALSYRKYPKTELDFLIRNSVYDSNILFVIKGERVDPKVIAELDFDLKILWFQDDLGWGFNLQLFESICWAYDLVFYFDKWWIERIKKFHDNVEFLPLAVSPEIFSGKISFNKKVYDVSFPCSIVGERELISFLLKNHNGVIGPTRDYKKVLEKSKIIVNWPVTCTNATQQRVYEAGASFCLVITKNIDEKYKIIENAVYVNDYDDLLWNISYFLKHEKQMEKKAEKLRKEILSKHTYDHRIDQIIKLIGRDLWQYS